MGHYYQQTETGVVPMHFVEMVSRPGELRPTRITDVRKWWKEKRVVVPSVTTVQNVLAKDALVNWKIDQHLEQAWLVASHPDFDQTKLLGSFPDFKDEVKRLTELQMDIAPSAGSDLHGLMELYVNGELTTENENYSLCYKVFDKIYQTTGMDDWNAERNFIADLGYGGQIDLSNDAWLIDYKTKQTKDKFKPGKMAYDDHRVQLAAYREGLGLPQARCANVFICLEDGQIDFHEHVESDLEKGWELFTHALSIWQLQNGWREMCLN